MTTFQDLRKNITDPTPFYAAVGLLDQAVGQVRTTSDEVAKKAAELSEQFKPEQLVERAQEVATERVERVQALPKRVEKQGKAAFAQAEESYAGLSKRGAGVVAELRKQQDAQAEQFINQGKATAATARKAAVDAQAFATKTVLTGRKEAAKQVEAVAGSVETAADTLGDDARTEVRSTASRVGRAQKSAPKKAAKPAAKKAPAKRPAKKAAKPAAKKAPAKPAAQKAPATSTTASTAANTAPATATKADTKA